MGCRRAKTCHAGRGVPLVQWAEICALGRGSSTLSAETAPVAPTVSTPSACSSAIRCASDGTLSVVFAASQVNTNCRVPRPSPSRRANWAPRRPSGAPPVSFSPSGVRTLADPRCPCEVHTVNAGVPSGRRPVVTGIGSGGSRSGALLS